jgi:nucleotide-binding universal stress UspA family protein
MMKKILVAIDGSDHAWKALDMAADLANKYDAELTVLHVVPYEPMPEELRKVATTEHMRIEEAEAQFHYQRSGYGDKLTGEAMTRARNAGVQHVDAVCSEGGPSERILAIAAEREVDAIVLGRRGLGHLAGLLMGSVSHKVSNLAECACITVV